MGEGRNEEKTLPEANNPHLPLLLIKKL